MFQFKQFNIDQSNAPFKVGTDGILLGAWCNIEHVENSLDIGTGTGIIGLMLAQRTKKMVTAIEINEIAYLQAKLNIEHSKWNNKVELINSSLQQFCKNAIENKKFDLIVSNPPYFVNSLKSINKDKSTARHTDTLSHKDILIRTKNIITEKGRLCVVLPEEEGKKYIASAKENGWFLTKLTKVYPNPNKPVKRLLIETSLTFSPYSEDNITIETGIKRHDYTEEYKSLTREFYIIFD